MHAVAVNQCRTESSFANLQSPNSGLQLRCPADWLISARLIDWFLYFYPPVTRKRRRPYALRTNSDSLKSYLCFRVFCLNFASDFFNLLLLRFHQAEIIIVKNLTKDAITEIIIFNLAIMAVVKTTLRTTRPRCRLFETAFWRKADCGNRCYN